MSKDGEVSEGVYSGDERGFPERIETPPMRELGSGAAKDGGAFAA